MSFTDDFLKGLNKRNVSLGEINTKNVSVDLGSDDFTKSFLSGLEKRKKKKEEEEIAIIKHDLFGGSSDDDDIAPVKDEDDSLLDFFQKGSFEDGYQFGDVTKSILGTAGDIGLNVVKGGASLLEGLVDVADYGIAAGADALGYDDYADRLRKLTATNLVEKFTKPADDYLDKYSVLGRTSDSIAQGIGQVGGIILTGGLGQAAGLGSAGVTALTTGTMGISGMGSGMGEAYQSGATDEEALQYGMIAGAADALSELMFGGLGKAVNATGLSVGLSSADDILAKKVSSLFTNQIAKNIAEGTIKAGAEGLEEVVAGVAQAIGKKLTYMSEEDMGQILKDENLLEQFVVGAFTSGIAQAPSIHSSNKTGTDFITGQTRNEQAVVEKEVEKRIAELEKDGKKLTGKEKSKIQEQVEKDMEKGYISTDTIEETLGGETWVRYKETIDQENALKEKLKATQEEFDTLNKMKQGEMTGEQIDRRADLKLELENLRESVMSAENHSIKGHLKQELSKQVSEMVRSDRLIESYNERARRGQAFKADLTKYDTKQRAVIENAQKSGILNNTNRTHEFVDMVAKIAADKGVLFDFTNNAKLKESGFAVDGKAVNGYVTKDGITVNIQSPKALNSTVGHEITHVLEGTELYTELQNSVIEYAKTKGEYQTRFDALTKLYENVEGADINAELTADLVGDYLFTDSDFINNLSVNHRNVFQKIYDEVKYLVKVATAGSKEARELEKVKRAFDKAYRESTKVESDSEADTKYSLAMVEKVQPKSDKWSRTHTTEEAMARFPNMWNVAADESEVRNPTQITSTVNSYRKIYNFLQNEGFNGTILDASSGLGYGTRAGIEEYGFNVEDIEPYPDKGYKPKYQDYSTLDKKYDVIISNAVLNVLPQDQRDALAIKMGEMLNDGGRLFVNVRGKDVESLAKTGKNIHLGNMEWIETVKGSYQKGFTKPELVAYLQDALGDGFTVKPTTMFGAVSAVVTKNGSAKYSLSDSEGRQLSNEQSEYFKDSAVRDKDGNLLVLYHGTQNDFTVFDIGRSGENYEGGWSEYGEGIYLTPDKKTAEYYGDNAGRGREVKLMEVYANIKSLFNVNDPVDFDISDLVQKYELTEFDERHIKRAGDRLINFLQHHNESVRDYLTSKGYDGIWEKGLNGDVYQVVAYAENQIKNTDNAKPTENPDIRYSLTDEEVRETSQKLNEANLQYDAKSGTVYSLSSLEDAFSYNKSEADYQTAREEYVNALMKATGKTSKEANSYLDSLFLVHDLIAEDRDRLDYEAAVNRTAWVSNAEYGGSIDFSTLCAKRRLFTGTFDAIQMALPDTVLNENDFLKIRDMLLKKGYESPCSMCYVEGSRAKHGVYVDKWLKEYLKTDPEWKPQIADFASTTRLEQTRIQHPEAYAAYKKAMNALSQRKPKEASVRTDYKGEILRDFRNDSTVAEKNKNGGVRFNSFSDFEIIHALDAMQVITDMARVGLNGQAYTKVKEFAEAFGNTGLKINLSLVAKDVDANGRLVMDETNGMNYAEAMDIRNRYSENVGTVIVVFNDAQLKAALADGSIDYVLPFHRSQWKKSQYALMGLPEATRDYTNIQNERYKNPKTGRPKKVPTGNIMPNEYWDFRLSGRENAQKYLDYINENSYIPKFDFLLNRVDGTWTLPEGEIGDGYFKLLIDFKMYDNDGWGSPQRPVLPEFNMPYIQQMLKDYKGGHQSFPVAHDVVNEFVESKKHSLSEEGAELPVYGDYNVYGSDVALETEVAPVAVSETENTTPVQTTQPIEENTTVSKEERVAMFPDEIAPDMELERLIQDKNRLESAMQDAFNNGDDQALESIGTEYGEVMERISSLENEIAETEEGRLGSIRDADAPPEMEAPYYEEAEPVQPANPMADRNIEDVGNRKVKAYMYENPEVKPYFQAEARVMLGDLGESVKGEKLYNDQLYYESGGEKGWSGVRRQTTSEIADLLDNYGYTYAQIEKGLNAIIEDNGKENNAVSKRIEFALNDRLRNGYTNVWGEEMPPDQDYIRLLQEKEITEYSQEAFESFMANADQYAPEEIAPVFAPVKASTEESSADDIAPTFEVVGKKGVPDGQQAMWENDATADAIEKRLARDKAALREDYLRKMAELQGEIGNQNTYISNRAKELYQELRGLRKGVKASESLGYLLDHGYEWSTIRSALVNIQHTPDRTVNQNSAIENIAREMLTEEYQNRVYELDDLETEYRRNIEQLEAEAERARNGEGEEPKLTRKQLHQNIVDRVKDIFHVRGFEFDDVLKKAKDLSTFATVDNTPQRVMEKALGYKQGQILSDITVNKVAQNETDGIQWLNSFTDRKNGLLAQISKQYNIKPGSKQSAAAQMYAEGFYVGENDEIIAYTDKELAADFPDPKVRNNIRGLANDPRIRKIYDETLAAINESRKRNAYPEIPRLDNYFLHFRAMEDTFSRLGLPFNPNDIRAKDLPTDLNGVTADLKPGQPYFASAMHRTGKRTSFDLLGGLEKYLTSAKNQIYHIDDIQTLRALRNYIAETYGQASGLENLGELSDEEAAQRIEAVYGSHLSTFAKFLNEEANVLAGKTALIDRGLEGIIGRRGITFLDTLNRQVGSSMVGYNISSSLTNFIAPVQALAKSNKADFVKGFAQTAANKVGSIFGRGDSFAEESPVMIRRKGAERFYRTPWQKLSDPGYVLMGAVDDISTELIARAKYNEFTRKGMDSQTAHIETDKWVSRLMGDRSLGQQPQLYNSKMLGIITKFQLEVRNQLDSQFYDTIQEAKVSTEDIQNGLARNAKKAAKITSTFVQLAVAQHLFGKAFESIAGYNPAFDIIEAIIKAFGWDDDEEDEDTVLDNIEQGFFELMGDMPYVSTMTGGRIPLESALPIKELYKGEDQYGNEKSRWETLSEAAPYWLLPGGYGQIKKTKQGLGMFDEDLPIAGSYTDSGKLRFPVEDTLGNRVQAALFGQYASENARDYFDNERKALGEKQIEEFMDSDLPIRDYWEYREGLSGLEKLSEKADYIDSLDLPISTKNLFINNIAGREEPIDLTGYGNYSSFEEFDFAKKNPEKYSFLKENGVSVDQYNSFDEDTKDVYSWAFNNPERYQFLRSQGVTLHAYKDFDKETKEAYGWAYENPDSISLAKTVGGIVEYNKIASGWKDLDAKDEFGNTVSGLKKQRVYDYIYGLDIPETEKHILFKSRYTSDDSHNYEIIDYLNNRSDISYDEMIEILKKLKFEVDEAGNIYW